MGGWTHLSLPGGVCPSRPVKAILRILYLNSPLYDFLTATVIEGLLQLRHERGVELVVASHSNYAPRSIVWSPERILGDLASFDWIFLGTNEGVNLKLFEKLDRPERSVCVDGSDESAYTHSPDDFRVYFKRELPIAMTPPENVLPCPFAVEHRWWTEGEPIRDIFFSAVFDPTTGQRGELLEELKTLEGEGIELGGIRASVWTSLNGVLRGQCSFRTWLTRRFAVGHNRAYHARLESSQLSLSMPGEGWDTGRFWEILGSGAGLVSPPPTIRMPHPFSESEHFIGFEDFKSLRAALEGARMDPSATVAMRRRARQHVLAHHTTKERARYVLDALTCWRGGQD